ncbi:hypothetical protein RvY_18903 [Ramazzottius varieornatus]|uniref:Uncharacterized protein n=1 Tax=Ramazzottius varieornatus TaxID=947166 RepID=A0A1D1WA77_RAMVA|nr:hypothetical protein RvY_18903 [Ramazzottius varieornatus]
MYDMKNLGLFSPVVDLGGNYISAFNPFRPDFHGKQTLADPYIPPAGPKSMLVSPITTANMTKQMDLRKIDKQELVWSEHTKKSQPFPILDKLKEGLGKKGKTFRPALYQKLPSVANGFPPPVTTVAPPEKPWYS